MYRHVSNDSTRGAHILRLLTRLAAGIALAITLLTAAPPAGSAAGDSFKITGIEVKGNWRTEKDLVLVHLQKMGVFPGTFLTPKLSHEIIQAVYDLKAFTDVQLFVQRTEECSSCVKLVVAVQEFPTIRSIRYEGLDTLDEDDVNEVMDLKENEVIDLARIRRVEEKIENLYMEKGYNRASVTHRMEKAPKNMVDLVFVMNERGKIYIKEIVLIGNEQVPDKKLREIMALKPGDILTWLTDFGILREQYLEHDVFMIEKYYQDHGFAKVKVEAPKIYLSGDERFITVVFNITEGRPYDFDRLYFKGDMVCRDWWPQNLPCTTDVSTQDQVFTLADLQKRSRLVSGERFNRTIFIEDLQHMTDLFMDQGYAYANVMPIPIFDEEKGTISLFMNMERGEKVYVERIDIVGNTKTRDKVIRREMVIAEGDLFSSTAVRVSKARIYRLGFFETVEIQQERGSKPDRIVLRVEIKERSTGTFQLGFGFSSLESFLFQAQVSQNNFLGRGQSLSLNAMISGQRQQFQIRFFEPYFLDSRWTLSTSMYSQQVYYPSQGSFGSYDKLSQGGELKFGYPIINNLYLVAGWRLSYEQVDVDNKFHAHLFRDGFTSSFLADVIYDSRDNRLYPTAGQYHTLSFEYADDYTGSQLEFARLGLNDQVYVPLWWKLVLKFNLELGWVFSTEETPNVNSASGDRDVGLVPISERYLLGGIYSIRGYDFSTISPKINVMQQDDPARYSSTYRAGGTKKFVANIELEFPILEQAGLKWIFFLDAGNTWSETEQWFYINQWSKNEYELPLGLYYSVGFGFRWYSPMGPLRFEWGIPLTPRPEDTGIAFQFSIGNPF